MDIPSYLLGKKTGGGGTSNTPIEMVVNNSRENPFIFEDYEPGIYIFTPAEYVYLKALNSSDTVYTDNASKLTTLCLLYYTKPSVDTPDGTVIAEIIRQTNIDNTSGRVIYYNVKYVYNSTKTSCGLLWTTFINVGEFDYVSKRYDQTITGKKTFSTLPESSAVPTTDNQLVNKKYVDDNAGGSSYTAGKNVEITQDGVINNTIPYNIEPHTHSISLGSSMSINKSSNSQSVFIGDYVSCNFPVNSNVLVGFQASVFSNQAVNSIAIGRSSGVIGADSVAFGFGARGSHNNSMAFGSRSETTKENQVIFGSQYNPINEINIYTSNGSKTLATEDYVNSAIANAITNALGGNY